MAQAMPWDAKGLPYLKFLTAAAECTVITEHVQ